MKATIDAAGRIVVPKSLRQALGLKPGQPLDIRAGDGRLEIEIAATPMHLKKQGKGMVAVPEAKLPTLTAEHRLEILDGDVELGQDRTVAQEPRMECRLVAVTTPNREADIFERE